SAGASWRDSAGAPGCADRCGASGPEARAYTARVRGRADSGSSRSPGYRPWPPPSDDRAFREIRDLLLRVAEPGQDLVVGLAKLGRRASERQAPLAVRDRVSENREVAQRRRVDRLGHLSMP